jgi:UTP--glucose-1-phosphate uridylyltransferase
MIPRAEELEARFAPFDKRMRAAGLSPAAIRAFRRQYARLLAGATGHIPGAEAGPIAELPDAELLGDGRPADPAALERCVVIKLNGGLGTSMGLSGPKSLLPVRGAHSFLDIIARQLLHLRRETGARLPLLLMNSFHTRAPSLEALARYPDLAGDLPPDFLQGMVPKILQADLSPAEWPADPDRAWCPPGHGDIYAALVDSGMLAAMLDRGYEYAFVSNVDNLGATVDPDILGYLASRSLPFLMEVADRSPADRKGGHLARRPDGQLVLREIAQCPPEEMDAFQDIQRYRYFNTNNLWLHLPSLAAVLAAGEGGLDLPLIRNAKTVDPTEPQSPPVFQLETAMGSAIAVFAGAGALRVPRRRFLPVKRTSDLLGIWSDAYRLDADWTLALDPGREGRAPILDLDPRFYGSIDDLQLRFPLGPPSLLDCRQLSIQGDIRFAAGIRVSGDVELSHEGPEPKYLPEGTQLAPGYRLEV